MAHVDLSEELVSQLVTDASQEEFYDRSFLSGGSFGVRISGFGRKSFFLIYRLNRRRKRFHLGTYPVMTVEEARAKALKLLRLVEQGRDPAAERRSGLSTPSTFSELAQLFLREHVSKRCSARTKTEYQRILRRELEPVWGDRAPNSITCAEIQAQLGAIADRGHAVMAERVRALSSKLFQFAISRKLVTSNPVRETRASRNRTVEDLNQQPSQLLTLEDIHELWRAFEAQPVQVAVFFKLLTLTGQRAGDLLTIRWRDIVIDTWHLANRRDENDRSYRVFLTPFALALLKELRSERAGSREMDSEFIFIGRNATDHIKHLGRATKRVTESLRTPIRWNPQILRRSVRAHLLKLRIAPYIVESTLANQTAQQFRFLARLETPEQRFEAQKQALSLWGTTVVRAIGEGRPRKVETGKVIDLFDIKRD